MPLAPAGQPAHFPGMTDGEKAQVVAAVRDVVRDADKGPPFFFQVRIGKNFNPFRLIKFRSMTVKQQASKRQFDAGDAGRVTRIGRVLRRTKIDELPELFNILRGDMSIVGPRPEVKKYVDLYCEIQNNDCFIGHCRWTISAP